MAFEQLLVLDLDETLVHATEDPLARVPDFHVGPYAVYERPHVRPFLEHVLARFAAVAVWTASTRSYALPVLSRIVDVDRLAFVWCRDRCTLHVDWDTREVEHLKDIRKLTKRGHRREAILFVDDTPAKLARSYGNLVTVRPYLGDEHDDELPQLAAYLDTLGSVPNVRTIEKRGWRTRG
ncbi:MAG: HAD family hydrolase [Deltaproteobacteria bacterium]|nr:HAD family hydrolase [Deltaproteobacteria bacterium]